MSRIEALDANFVNSGVRIDHSNAWQRNKSIATSTWS
jgi:hypothetical protein